MLTGAALRFGLSGHTHDHVQSVLGAFGSHIDHVAPHVTRTRLTVLDLALKYGRIRDTVLGYGRDTVLCY